MKQLQLSNGDLVFGANGIGLVEGPAKVRQDLGIAVREALGADRFHPRWGTILTDFIGRPQDAETAMLIRAEVARVLQNYIVMQADMVDEDADAGGRPRFSSSEIVTGIRSIDIQARADQVNVRVIVVTADGESVTVIRTVEME